jgi:hypothetical protein
MGAWLEHVSTRSKHCLAALLILGIAACGRSALVRSGGAKDGAAAAGTGGEPIGGNTAGDAGGAAGAPTSIMVGASGGTGGRADAAGLGGSTVAPATDAAVDSWASGGTGSGGTGSGGTGGGGTGGVVKDAGTTPATCSGTQVTAAANSNNYYFWSKIKLPPITVAPLQDLLFDWTGPAADLTARPIDTKRDINLLTITMWRLPLPELEDRVSTDTLVQRDLVVVPLTLATDGSHTSARLTQFTAGGSPVDRATLLSYFDADFYSPPSNYSYLVTGQGGSTIGQNVRLMQAFQLDPASTNERVKLAPGSARLAYGVDLRNLVRITVPLRRSDIIFDWSGVTKTAAGAAFDPSGVGEVMVGHYTQGPMELEEKFSDLESLAGELYRARVDAVTSLDLSRLTDRNGAAFAGIDENSLWLIALRCGSCHSPAPWFLSILAPCAGGKL